MAAVANGSDELLTPVGEHLPAVAASRDGDETDDGQREDEAEHHAEDEGEHSSRVPRERALSQTEPPGETEL